MRSINQIFKGNEHLMDLEPVDSLIDYCKDLEDEVVENKQKSDQTIILKQLISEISKIIPISDLAMHFHDTYGQAVANIHQALQAGIRRFDSAVAGLGGCPYARGASGNVATEDVLYLMHGLGLQTGVDIFKVVAAGDMICKILGRKNQSKVANALLANQ